MLADFQPITLDNGTRLHLLPTDRFKTLTVRAYLRRHLEPEVNTRVALVTRLVGRGCLPWPTTRALARRLDDLYGSALGTGVAKSGVTQLAYFHLETPDESHLPGKPDVVSPALATLGQVMTEPVAPGGAFPDEVTAQEAAYLARDIRGLINDRTRYSVFRCTEEMCQNGPHGLSELGRLEDLGSQDPRKLYLQYRALIDHSPMDVFVVGNVSEGACQLLARTFSFSRHPMALPGDRVPPRFVSGVREVVERLDIAQARLCLGLRYDLPSGHPDYYALLMYDGILGGFPHSKLFSHVREKSGLSYDVGSFVSTALGFQYIIAGVDPAHYHQVLDIIAEQRRHLLQGSISDEEMESTREALVSRARAVRDSPSRMIGAAYSGLLTGRTDSPEEQIAQLYRTKLGDVVRVAGGVELDTIYLLAPDGGGVTAPEDDHS